MTLGDYEGKCLYFLIDAHICFLRGRVRVESLVCKSGSLEARYMANLPQVKSGCGNLPVMIHTRIEFWRMPVARANSFTVISIVIAISWSTHRCFREWPEVRRQLFGRIIFLPKSWTWTGFLFWLSHSQNAPATPDGAWCIFKRFLAVGGLWRGQILDLDSLFVLPLTHAKRARNPQERGCSKAGAGVRRSNLNETRNRRGNKSKAALRTIAHKLAECRHKSAQED